MPSAEIGYNIKNKKNIDFIKSHLVSKIKKLIKAKQDYINFYGFFYFDNKCVDVMYNNGELSYIDNKKINRVSHDGAFLEYYFFPLDFKKLNGKTLI